MKTGNKGILLLLVGLVILSLVWFIWDGFIKDKTPQFFPINEQQSEYSIVKSSDGVFMVKYNGPNVFSGISSVIIGKTDYDLNQYLEKKVMITKGSFKSGFTKQCIANICKDIGGPYAVIVIEKMEEILEVKPRDKVIEYVVAEGDSLTQIADRFNVSTNTIKWANNLSSESVKLGQTLKILPVTGVMHTVSKGEDVYSIAQKYQVEVKKIIDFSYNTFNDDKYSLTIGQTIIVPDGIKP